MSVASLRSPTCWVETLRTATCVRDNLMKIQGQVGGFCGEAAYALAHLIAGTVVLGSYQFEGKPSEFENPHYWVEKEGYIIDPTAEQYGEFEGPIVIKIGDKHYVYTDDTFRDEPSKVRKVIERGFIDPAISVDIIRELLKANCTAGIELSKRKPAQGLLIEGWHSSPTGKLGISDPETSTEGVGYYVAIEKETAEFFGRVVEPVSIKLFNPLDARGEAAYILLEEDVLMDPPVPCDSEWLSAIKEAVSRSGTTDENWGRNQARLHQALTDVLQDRGYDGILIEDWAVKFASPRVRAGMKGYLKRENPAHIRPEIEAMAVSNPFIHVESADVKETFIYADHPVAIVDVFEFGGMWNPVNKLIMFDSKTWRSMNEEEKRILLDHEIVEREFAMEDYAQYQSHSAAVGANHAKTNAILSERYGADVIEDLIARGLLANEAHIGNPERQLSQVIREVVKEYRRQGKSPEDINTGWCEPFADEVIKRFLHADYGSTDDYTDINETAIIGGRKAAFPGHTWIRYKGRHYDSEAPEGVDRWFDLPIFHRESELASWSAEEKRRIKWE